MPLPDPFDNVGMRRWVFRTLAAEDDDLATAQMVASTAPQNVQKARELLRSKKFALEQADKGDVEPLRRKYPDLAKFIHPPKRKRGQRDIPTERWTAGGHTNRPAHSQAVAGELRHRPAQGGTGDGH